MKKPIFTGAGVAIVTPFYGEDLKINFPLFEEIMFSYLRQWVYFVKSTLSLPN